MARAPNQKADEARKLFEKGLKLKEIAAQLNVPEGTVRRWKNTYEWDKKRSDRKSERSDKKSERSDRKKGGQPGNKNAEGHGGTGPPGNKNAVKTGEFETLFFNMLTPEEKTLTEILPEDKKQLILQEIKLLMVREYRMMKRIERMETATWNRSDSGEDASKEKGMADLLQSAEEALTRVQARQQKAIETLHMFGRDDARAELEAMKLEFEILKQGNQETEETDDGFLEAMNGAAQEVWKE